MSLREHQKPVGKSNEWLTPRWILEKLGEFDLDPCAPAVRPWDTAKHHYAINDDGLQQKWFGRVWMNPPFDRFQRPRWIKRMCEHGNGIMLIPAACETYAFRDYVFGKSNGILMMHKRPHFCDLTGREEKGNSGQTICLVPYGEENFQILKSSGLGVMLVEAS